MDAFNWDSCYVTGLTSVDEQHRRLVEMINRFGEAVTSPQGTDPATVQQLLVELSHYAELHFRDEQRQMLLWKVDRRHVEAHCSEHDRFLNDVGQISTARHIASAVVHHAGPTAGSPTPAPRPGDPVADSTQTSIALLNFLSHWLSYHILGTDQVMARQVVLISAGRSPEAAYEATLTPSDPATAALLRSLGVLFSQVSERNRALYRLNLQLEERVAERTRELTLAMQRLEDMAMTDVLTGLPNRRHALRALERGWESSAGLAAPLSCIVIDADAFKQVNDRHGHDAGDEVLRQLARRLLHEVRTDDTVCRLGGDEFLVVCAGTPLPGAIELAEKLRDAVSTMRVAVGDGFWQGSISVGVATRRDGMAGIDSLLREADESVYLAKRGGRNQVRAAASPVIGSPAGRSA